MNIVNLEAIKKLHKIHDVMTVNKEFGESYELLTEFLSEGNIELTKEKNNLVFEVDSKKLHELMKSELNRNNSKALN